MERLIPRYKWGDISPRNAALHRGSEYQFYRIVPPDVMVISIRLGIRDYTPELVEEAMPNLWDRVDTLVAQQVDHIILAGAPISGQLGRKRVTSILREIEQKTALPTDAPIEATISAMRHLGLRKIAVAGRRSSTTPSPSTSRTADWTSSAPPSVATGPRPPRP